MCELVFYIKKSNLASIGSGYSLPKISLSNQLFGNTQTLLRIGKENVMNGRKRNIQIKFWVTEEEKKLIHKKMRLVPTQNMAAYLRKMAIDGYIVQVDHTDVKK